MYTTHSHSYSRIMSHAQDRLVRVARNITAEDNEKRAIEHHEERHKFSKLRAAETFLSKHARLHAEICVAFGKNLGNSMRLMRNIVENIELAEAFFSDSGPSRKALTLVDALDAYVDDDVILYFPGLDMYAICARGTELPRFLAAVSKQCCEGSDPWFKIWQIVPCDARQKLAFLVARNDYVDALHQHVEDVFGCTMRVSGYLHHRGKTAVVVTSKDYPSYNYVVGVLLDLQDYIHERDPVLAANIVRIPIERCGGRLFIRLKLHEQSVGCREALFVDSLMSMLD